ncbi:hypothetical protein MPSEU_000763400 [Mayamaea pseudoterrestris]|nr:hypothetical protein MPSEU_000763400 [Mayamaea pseudoterrestris]
MPSLLHRSLAATFIVASLLATANAECGVDQAVFNTHGLPQGYEGELYAAVRCYVSQDPTFCSSRSLPKAARGYKQVKKYYGSSISTWCTGEVTDFYATFYGLETFNEPLLWDTSKAQSFNAMFGHAASFNQPSIGDWDTSQVQNFDTMFIGATAFAQSLSKWNTSSAKSFSGTFNAAASFNGDLSSWDFSNVCQIDFMFMDAVSYKQNLNFLDQQLQAKNCEGRTPTTIAMLEGTSCPLAGDPSKVGGFCQPKYDVQGCLDRRFKKFRCSCGEQAKCVKKLMTGACKKKFLKTSGDKNAYAAEVDSLWAKNCS